MSDEKHVTESQLDKLRSEARDIRTNHRKFVWLSLKTVAGWILLASLIGAGIYDLLKSVLPTGPKS